MFSSKKKKKIEEESNINTVFTLPEQNMDEDDEIQLQMSIGNQMDK